MHTACGPYHRDVKPANVLLTLQNGPQLLDFNLADSPHSADQAQAALHGGTLPYMAPEQIEAFLESRALGQSRGQGRHLFAGAGLPRVVDGAEARACRQRRSRRSARCATVLDRRPFLDVAVRRFNPSIPHALEAIVAKCLTLSPDDRYPRRRSLAQDLDRFLKHQPLKARANPSRRERLGNWLTRHRRVLTTAASVFALSSAFLTARMLQPTPIERTPAFLSAVQLLEKGESAGAADRFRSLEKVAPSSCLVKFYLGFAQNAWLKRDDEKQYDVDDYVRNALLAPVPKRS